MNLLEFIDSKERNLWIEEPGLTYYVRKSLMFPGVIELANCSARPETGSLGYWRFLKKYEKQIPFIAEQVLNDDLAALLRQRKWLEKRTYEIPQFASPLFVKMHGDSERFKLLWNARDFEF